mmetsp:Transcript_12321/g.10924  ORF Transcript_12321/g.10924 Transcript_12321/m.10924 type:complete len:210 (+) Transcript_12321:304-933(+)
MVVIDVLIMTKNMKSTVVIVALILTNKINPNRKISRNSKIHNFYGETNAMKALKITHFPLSSTYNSSKNIENNKSEPMNYYSSKFSKLSRNNVNSRLRRQSTISPNKSSNLIKNFKKFTVQTVYGNPIYQTQIGSMKLGEVLEIDKVLQIDNKNKTGFYFEEDTNNIERSKLLQSDGVKLRSNSFMRKEDGDLSKKFTKFFNYKPGVIE